MHEPRVHARGLWARRAAALPASPAMSREVAGEPEGATLLDAIERGSVPFPASMGYTAWLKWRRETGSRPTKKRDGVSTSPKKEAVLWHKVMGFLHHARKGG